MFRTRRRSVCINPSCRSMVSIKFANDSAVWAALVRIASRSWRRSNRSCNNASAFTRHVTFQLCDTSRRLGDQILVRPHRFGPNRGDELERTGRTKLPAVDPLAHGGELAPRDLRCQGGTRRAEHGDQSVGSQEHLQWLKTKTLIRAAGKSIDRAEMVVGVEAHLRHRRPAVALLDVGRPDVNQLSEQRHAFYFGVVEVQPERAAISSGGVTYLRHRQRCRTRRQDQPCLHENILTAPSNDVAESALPTCVSARCRA